MKIYTLVLIMLFAGLGKVHAQAANTTKSSGPEMHCYVSTDSGKTYMNAIRFTKSGTKIKGQLMYMMENEIPMIGDIEGTVKDNIILADWTYTKGEAFYKVPVSFRITATGVWQKPSAVDAKGVPYIPEDADFLYEFPKVDCSKYPEMPKNKFKLKRVG